MLSVKKPVIKKTPLPWRELITLLIMLATESIAFQYLFPFVPFMVRGFGIEEQDVGYYSGWIASSFMTGQFISSIFWGRMSDIIGLKPVLMIGMTFTFITVFLFGWSKSLEWALAVRFIGGLFNGVLGVSKTYIGLITDETNEAQAFGMLALCWGTGGTLGPMIGGLLSQPANKYPRLFAADSIWAEHPFLLPCCVTSLIPATGVCLSWMFLKEPSRKKKQPQSLQSADELLPAKHGVEEEELVVRNTWEGPGEVVQTSVVKVLADDCQSTSTQGTTCSDHHITSTCSSSSVCVVGIMSVAKDGIIYTTTHHSCCDAGNDPAYPACNAPACSRDRQYLEEASLEACSAGLGLSGGRDGASKRSQALPLLADRSGIHTGGGEEMEERRCRERLPGPRGKECSEISGGGEEGGAGAGIGVAVSQLRRGALSFVLARKALISIVSYGVLRLTVIGLDDTLPLLMSTPKRDGGMAFSSNDIGLALVGQGVLLVLHVLFIFPMWKERLGTLQLFWLAALSCPLVTCVTPFLADMQRLVSPSAHWAVIQAYLGLKVMAFSTGFTSVTLLINNSAPARVIGTVNGFSQTGAAFTSMIAPSLAGTLFSWSLQNASHFPFDFHFVFFFLGTLGTALIACAALLPPCIAHRYVES